MYPPYWVSSKEGTFHFLSFRFGDLIVRVDAVYVHFFMQKWGEERIFPHPNIYYRTYKSGRFSKKIKRTLEKYDFSRVLVFY